MGLFKVATDAVAGNLSDQWLERIEPGHLDNQTLATMGVVSRKNDKRTNNKKGSSHVISNGSLIQVPENAFMILVDSGKIIGATDEAGFYQVDNSRAPSLFYQSEEGKEAPGYTNTSGGDIPRPGGVVNTIKDSFERFKFGGSAPYEQKVIYINKQEIPGIRFGTPNPIIFADRVLMPGTMLSTEIRAHGTYSIKINDPILFYRSVFHKTGDRDFKKDDLAEQYIDEFLAAFSDAIASMSYENCSVIELPTRQRDIGQFMATTLDEDWLKERGFYIRQVAVRNMSYDEETKKFIDQHRQDALLLDPNRRAARMTRGVSSGIENAGSNEGGSMMGFAGIGMGMNMTGGNGLGGVMNPQPEPGKQGQNLPGWKCSCGASNQASAAFCPHCGSKKPEVKPQAQEASWFCSKCGHENTGKFCSNCGSQKPGSDTYACNNCGFEPADPKNPPKFCPNCGDPFNDADKK